MFKDGKWSSAEEEFLLDNYVKEKIINKIINISNGSRINSAYIQKNYNSLFRSANRYFGNWRSAVEAAGFDYDEILKIARETRIEENRYWSKEKIIEELLKYKEQNIELHLSNIKNVNSALLSAAVRYFGSWKEALECAGLNYNEIAKSKPTGYWTKERITKAIKTLYSSREDLNYLNIFSNHNDILCAARREFGTWESAVIAAEFDYDSFRKKSKDRSFSNEEIMLYIRKLYNTGKNVNAKSIYDLNNNLYNQARAKFGSWKKVIVEAGINYDEIKKHGQSWTKDRIIHEIKELREQEVPLNSRYIRQYNRFLYYGAGTHFGSWQKAIFASGINYNEIRKEISKQILLGKIFEQKCKEMFDNIGLNYIYQPKFIFESEICIPDFINEEDVWIDVKLHSWTSTIEQTKEKYLKYTDLLKIIFLNGNDRISEDSVEYIRIDYFYPLLIENDLYESIEQFELLKKGIIPK